MAFAAVEGATFEEQGKREMEANIRQAEKDDGLYKKHLAKQRREKMKAFHPGATLLHVVEPTGDVSQLARINLLSTHRIISHRFAREKQIRPDFDNRKIEPRNFAILLLQKLEPKIDQLKIEFQSQRHGMNLSKFSNIILEYLDAIRREKLESDLLKDGKFESEWYFATAANTKVALEVLFQAIDFQDSGRMKWEPFIGYCIDASMKGTTGVDYDSYVMSYEACFHDQAVQYEGVRKLRYAPEIGKVLCCEMNTLKILDPADWQPIKTSFTVGGLLLDAEYITDRDMFITSSSDLMLTLFDPETPNRPVSMHVEYSQVACRWSRKWKRLFTGCRQGTLTIWEVKARTYESRWTPPSKLSTFQAHKEAITELLFHPLDGSILSCSLDSSIVIREPQAGTVIQTFTGHQAGVLSMTYSSEYNFLISGGVEPCPLLWVISNSTKDRPFTLRDPDAPHKAPIASVQELHGTAQVASLDLSGLIKVWDVRTFGCLYTMQCKAREKKVFKVERWSSCVYIPSEKQIAVNSNVQLYFFEYSCGLAGLTAPADYHPISHVYYAASTKVFVTTAGRNIRVWNASTGELHSKLDDLAPDEITAFCMDVYERKFFIGTHKGVVRSHTLSNGVLVCDFGSTFKNEVTGLSYMSWERKYLLACSCDGSIKIMRDVAKSSEASSILVNRAPIIARCCDYSRLSALCCIGDARNTLHLWQVNLSLLDSQFKLVAKICLTDDTPGNKASEDAPTLEAKPGSTDIQTVRFLHGYAAFVATDSKGHAFVYNVQPAPYPYSLLAVWQTPLQPGGPPGVGAADFLQEECCVFLGDEHGYIRSYLLEGVLAVYGMPWRGTEVAPPPDPASVTVPMVDEWQAHTDGIRTLHIIQSLKVVVTGSFDQKVHIYTHDGQFKGCLDQNGFSFASYDLQLPDIPKVDMQEGAPLVAPVLQVDPEAPADLPEGRRPGTVGPAEAFALYQPGYPLGNMLVAPRASFSQSEAVSRGSLPRSSLGHYLSPDGAVPDVDSSSKDASTLSHHDREVFGDALVAEAAKPRATFWPAPAAAKSPLRTATATAEPLAGARPQQTSPAMGVKPPGPGSSRRQRKTAAEEDGATCDDRAKSSSKGRSLPTLARLGRRGSLQLDGTPAVDTIIPDAFDAEAQSRMLESFLSWQLGPTTPDSSWRAEPSSPRSPAREIVVVGSPRNPSNEISKRDAPSGPPPPERSQLLTLPTLVRSIQQYSSAPSLPAKAAPPPGRPGKARLAVGHVAFEGAESPMQQRKLLPGLSQLARLRSSSCPVKRTAVTPPPPHLPGPVSPKTRLPTSTPPPRSLRGHGGKVDPLESVGNVQSTPFTKFWSNVRDEDVRGVEAEGWAAPNARLQNFGDPTARWPQPADPLRGSQRSESGVLLFPDNSCVDSAPRHPAR